MEEFREKEQLYTKRREALEYGVYHVIAQLEIEAYITREPLPFERRTEGEYRRLTCGEHWGDLFDCAWFHFTGTVPQEYREKKTAVLIDLSGEGLVVDAQGNPVQGLTSATSRNEFPLGLWGKRTIELADCSTDGCHVDFWVDAGCSDIEGQYKNQGRVREACIAAVDELCRAVFYDWVVCQSLYVGLCENQDPYGAELTPIMDRAAELLAQGTACQAGNTDQNQRAAGQAADTDQNQRAADQAAEMEQSGGDTEALLKDRHAYAESSKELESSGERISEWPDTETNHTLRHGKRVDADVLLQVQKELAKILNRRNEGSALTYSSIGHSHLDLLFLWPERETYRKCARTYSTVLKLMDRFPEYKFVCSQAPVYLWMKEKYPQLYQRILEKIREGRWEVQGAFWIECDTNLPSGEALVRQLLYGKRFFQQEFGLDMQVGFLPDVFGYSAALPQLFAKSRVPYFMTNKLSMNDTNRFPRYTFWWQGIDGSRVLTHMLPENSYTSASVPQMAIYGEHHDTDLEVCPEGLQLFGLGDGGGGPGYEHMERRRRSRDLKGCPPLRDEFVGDFFHRIEQGSERYQVWNGELYFERHQGTYTSIAHQKWWNRRLEIRLHEAEWLCSMAAFEEKMTYPRAELYEIWKDVMLYQFHDCLPGSSIRRVYDETQARYREMDEILERLICRAQNALEEPASDGLQEQNCLNVYNDTSFTREEWLQLEGREYRIRMKPYAAQSVTEGGSPYQRITAEGRILENEHLRMRFEADGTVSEYLDKDRQLSLLPEGERGNVLLLYPDELTHWDINKDYLKSTLQQACVTGMTAYREGHIQTLRICSTVGTASEITQEIMLADDSRRVDFRTHVSWKEEYQMLRVKWPTIYTRDYAECEIQFGTITRPTHHNTSWDEAKFEVCAHKWVNAGDAGGGLALLNNCKYGYKIWDNVLELCLLRSQNCPCEQGDYGEHDFTYALYSHAGDPVSGGVVREGYLLNYPLLIHRSSRRAALDWISVDTENVVLDTVKCAEDEENCLLLRLYEAQGAGCRAQLSLKGQYQVELCNLLEEAEPDQSPLEVHGDQIQLRFHPFEVQTLKIRRKQEEHHEEIGD